jgi:hypothetical protein
VEEMQGDSASCLKGQKGAALNFIRQGSEGLINENTKFIPTAIISLGSL